jgi:hypothetical protein
LTVVILAPLKVTWTCTVPNWLDSSVPSVTTTVDELGLSEVDGTVGVVVVAPEPDSPDEVGGSDVDGAVVTDGCGAGWAAAVLPNGVGSNRHTAMNPAMESATTKMVFFTVLLPLRRQG